MPGDRNVRDLILSVVVVTLGLVLTMIVGPRAVAQSPASVLMSEAPSPDDDFTAQVEEVLRTFPNLSWEEAYERVAAQPDRHAVVNNWIAAGNGGAFAGAKYDPSTDTLQVLVTETTEIQDLVEAGEEASVEVQTQLVNESIGELDRAVQEAMSALSASSLEQGANAGVDVAANRITIAVPSSQAEEAEAIAAELGVDARVVELVDTNSEDDICNSVVDCGRPIRSGIGLAREGSTNLRYCSLGFTLKNSEGTKWVTTAGHCGETTTEDPDNSRDNWRHDSRNIGRMTARCDNCSSYGDVDAARIVIEDSWWNETALGYFYNYRNSENPLRIGFVPGSESDLYVGDVVCLKAVHVGESSDRCGIIEDVSNELNGGLARVGGYDACGGDSGGAWIYTSASGVHFAYGVHSKSTEDSCHAAGGKSWFTTTPRLSAWLRATSSPDIYIAQN